MFKLTISEIEQMEKSINDFEEDSKTCEALTDSGCMVRDLEINAKPCRICFIISYVDDEEEEDDEEDGWCGVL